MVHKQVSESGIITWSSPTLSGIPGVRHRFFGRTGGVSEGSYASLNLNNAEDALTKARNMELVAGVMGVAAGDIRGVQQKHGSNIVTLTEANIHMDMYNLEADGIVTNMHGVYVSVVTADCCPVLLCDAENAVVAAVHAGWRSAFSGVLPNAIAQMVALGSNQSSIVAAIGPAIAQKSYEVGEEFYSQFIAYHPHSMDLFILRDRQLGQGRRWLFDLKGFVLRGLDCAGVQRVEDLGVDTYRESDSLFSCRRSAHAGVKSFGCQISVIGLE